MKPQTKTITYHASINNGSFFQAYALQKTLLAMGYDNRILDIQSKELKTDYALFRKPSSISDLVKNLISLIHYKSLSERKTKFETARKKYLSLTDEYEKLDEYLKETGDYDSVYIAGSDQIWNVSTSDFTQDYFLPQVRKKISYSASGGTKITLIELEKYRKEINEFSSLSVRESDLKAILLKLGMNDVSVTLDPTLLMDKSEYLKLIEDRKYIKGKYIFLYTIKCEPEVLKMAKRISKKLKMPVYTIFNTYRSEKNLMYGVKNIYDAGPFDFLNIINNASLVLTDSFHGNVFSVILEKEFYYISTVDKNGNMKRDDRIDDFLEKTKMINYKISVNETIDSIRFKRNRDFSFIPAIIEKMREESFDYLRKALGQFNS